MESIRLQASRLIALRCLELINSRRFIGHGLDVFKRVDWELDGRKQLSSYGDEKSQKRMAIFRNSHVYKDSHSRNNIIKDCSLEYRSQGRKPSIETLMWTTNCTFEKWVSTSKKLKSNSAFSHYLNVGIIEQHIPEKSSNEDCLFWPSRIL